MDFTFSPASSPTLEEHATGGQEPSRCDGCGARHLCPGKGIATQAAARIATRRLRRGQALYRTGDTFSCCWWVRSGIVKSSLELEDGREQITGFHFPGELIGADAIASGRHPTKSIALEDCTLCALPIDVSPYEPGAAVLRMRIWSAIAMAALRERELTALLASSIAEQRVAAFLVDVAARLAARGWSPREFYLRMTRADIGNLLGVSIETVSRSFTALARQGLIEVRRKHVRIVDARLLQEHAPPAALAWLSPTYAKAA